VHLFVCQNRIGDTERRRRLLKMHHVRREFHGAAVERDKRGERELADEELLARLGI